MLINHIIDELKTGRDWVRWMATQFNHYQLYFGQGTDNAWDEALLILLGTLDLSLEQSDQILSAKLLKSEREKLANHCEKRIKERMPAAYLVNLAYFAGLPFYVDQRVLIPRSPFAELIERQFAPWLVADKIHHVLEVGTGSGCMAIATALSLPYAKIDAVDVSIDALAVAKINVENYHLLNRVNLIQSDTYHSLGKKRYDLIISNPHYVGRKEFASLPAEYSHEPQTALLAENEGLAIVEKIIHQAPLHLNEGGMLIVEVGNTQQLLMAKHPRVPFIWVELERGGHGVFVLTGEQCRQLSTHERQ